jgi:hypothetical protein
MGAPARLVANRYSTTALLAAAAIGSAAVGFGPHQLGQPLRHQSTAPPTQHTEATSVAAAACRFQRDDVVVAAAMAKSIGV